MKKPLQSAIVCVLLVAIVITGCGQTSTLATEKVASTELDVTEIILDPTATSTAEPTVDPKVMMDSKRTEVLNYLTKLSTEPFKGVISGQNCYHGTEITDSSWAQGYTKMIADLQKKTGKWVGISGVDYEYLKIFTPEELTQTNEVLIDYANAGGLVFVTWTPLNPWVNDESDLANNPGSYDSLDGSQNEEGINKVTSLDDLLNPEKEVHTVWMRKLDRVAAALQELRDAGVVVLFRPMQEMNGNWFWWGMKSHPNDPSSYVNLYQNMHDYFTNEKQLNNLIWIYSPASSFGETNSSAWVRTVDWAYPGDDVVDIVAGTNYADDMLVPDYDTFASLNKPMGIAEFGPTIGGPAATNCDWDTSKIATIIKEKYPKFGFWVNWHSYEKQCWSLISNKNADVLMNNPDVITRDDFTWSWMK